MMGIRTAICLRSFCTQKKDAKKEPWLKLVASEACQRDRAQRFRVEQPFGPAKQKHGFGRCRYLGLARYWIQALFTFLVSSKRIIKLLTGITFRPQAKGRKSEVFEPVFADLPAVGIVRLRTRWMRQERFIGPKRHTTVRLREAACGVAQPHQIPVLSRAGRL